MNLAKSGEGCEGGGPYTDEDEEDESFPVNEVNTSFEFLGRGEQTKIHTPRKLAKTMVRPSHAVY